MSLMCDVYKSPKTPDLYLYVSQDEGLERVPEALLNRFGPPDLALSFELSKDRQLAREDAAKVLEAIQDSGFYLQLPPQQYPT